MIPMVTGSARHTVAVLALTFLLGRAAPASAAPVEVALSSPASGQTFLAPANVILGAVVTGPVLWVDFYHNGTLLGWADQEPYTLEWTGLAPAAYTVEARATDASGQTVVSDPISFSVVADSTAILTRGPYIMMGHFTNQSTIVWRTEYPEDSWVEYGLTSAYGLAAGSSWLVQQHEVTLTGLQPGRTYHYRVRSGGRSLVAAEFRSGKLPGTPVRIAWTADHRSGAGGPIAGVMRSYKPDLILDAGDLMDWCNAGLLDSQFFSAFGGVLQQSPFYWSPGNHEGSGCGPCLEAFGLLPEDHESYSIEYGDLQVISLNSENLPPPEWLRQKLAASSKPWRFVFTHVPSYSASGGHGEWEGTHLRANYIPIFEEFGGAAWITGHSHYYWRSQPINGVTHLIVGSGGAPIYRLGGLPAYTAGADDTAQVFAFADLDGDFMHIRAINQYYLQVDETLIDRQCAFQLDGHLDGSATPVAQSEDGLSLWAAVAGRYLYVAATNATPEDYFVFLSRVRSDLTRDLGPTWSKDGQVMLYDAFLAGQATATSNGWFNSMGDPFGNLRVARSTTLHTKDAVLEGVIDLEALYGSIPPLLYLAATPYDPAPGGTLNPLRQCPAGNSDPDILRAEFVEVNTAAITLNSGRLVSISVTASGTAILEFLGQADTTYDIEASVNLRDWSVVGTRTSDAGGHFTFSHADAWRTPHQFYRTRHATSP